MNDDMMLLTRDAILKFGDWCAKRAQRYAAYPGDSEDAKLARKQAHFAIYSAHCAHDAALDRRLVSDFIRDAARAVVNAAYYTGREEADNSLAWASEIKAQRHQFARLRRATGAIVDF
jgi:hypothetical protein